MNDIEKNRTKKIVLLHGEVEGLLKTSLDKAIEVGRLLCEQKLELRHGQFIPWVKANLPFSDRTARHYMELHRHRNLLKSETVSDLNSAYEFIGKAKKAEKYGRSLSVDQVTREREADVCKPARKEGIETRIRRGVQVDLGRLRAAIDEAKQQIQGKIDGLVEDLELTRVLTQEVTAITHGTEPLDLNTVVADLEGMSQRALRANLLGVHFAVSGYADRLSKALREPVYLLGCRRVITGKLGALPVWGCGVHTNCGFWHMHGWQAGPPEVHIMSMHKYPEGEQVKCPACEEECQKLYVMAQSGDLICGQCYWDLCNELSEKVKNDIEKSVCEIA